MEKEKKLKNFFEIKIVKNWEKQAKQNDKIREERAIKNDEKSKEYKNGHYKHIFKISHVRLVVGWENRLNCEIRDI